MKKIYTSISIVCLASMGALAQTAGSPTPTPPANSNVAVKGTSTATTCDGSASFNQGNVTAWKWYKDTTLLQTNGVQLTSLCDGNYYIKYLDSAGVNTITNQFAIGLASGSTTGTTNPNPTPPANSNVAVKGTSTATTCDGSASFNQANVTAWKWYKDTTLLQTNGVQLTSLCDGNYSVKYLDSAGVNTITNQFAIGLASGSTTGTNPGTTNTGGNTGGGGTGTCASFEAHAVATNVTAAGACDGKAEIVIVKAGTAPYTYKWSNSKLTTKALTGLCAGSFQMIATDSAGCTYTDSVQVFPFNATDPCLHFKAHVVPHNETSPGACDGTAEGVADGGAAPYSYTWNNVNVTTAINPNLCSGMVIVTATDGNKCIARDSAILGALATINSNPCQFFAVRTIVINDTAHTAANACGGYVEAVCKGGRGLLTFIWSDNTANSTPFRHNACKGAYTVTVRDSTGCSATINTFVGANQPPVMTPPAPGVMPLHIFVKTMDVSNAALCNGKAYARADGGHAPYKYSFGATSTTGAICPMDSLCAGFYTVNVMDADSATASFVFVIGSPKTTFTPARPPFVNPIIKDTLVANAITNCVINYDLIDSIRITHSNLVGADTLKAVWTVFQSTGGTHLFTQNYKVNATAGIFTCVLDLFCTNRASGDAKAQDQIDIGLLSGIKTVETINTSIYPNPFDNQLNVVTDKNATVNIVDITGRNVYTGVINAGINTISTDQLNSGLYIINIRTAQKMITRKLIKH